MITEDLIQTTVVELLRKAETILPQDIKDALQNAYDIEEDELPKVQLKNILDNIQMAEDQSKPMCQDTGVPIIFVTFGKVEVPEATKLENAIIEGVKTATEQVPLRPNTVHPLTRKNAGDNTGVHMPYINYKNSDNDHLEITVMPKGAGSENMSALGMLLPAQGVKGIKEFALQTLINAGGKPCPPIIIGMGIGGSADISMKLAKEALLRPVNEHNPDQEIAVLEKELYEALNAIGIGPMGLGGKTTLLGLNIEYAHCHTASHPVAINIQCWAARRATARIYEDGKVEYPSHR